MNDLSGLRFRSSLNGFRKKDVSQYIDALSRNAAAEKAGLEDALAEEKEKSALLDGKLTAAAEASASLAKEAAELRAEQERTAKELEAAKEELSALRSEAEKLSEELALAKERLSSLESEKAALENRVADFEGKEKALDNEMRVVTELELAARIRAEESENSAKERAAAIMEKCRRDFADTRSVVDHYKADTDVMIGSAEKHLSSLQSLIEDFKRDMDSSKKGLDEFSLDGGAGTGED